MDEKKMNDIIKQSQNQFISQKKEELLKVMKSLMYLLLDENKDEYDNIYRFFHSIKGTAGTINLLELSVLGENAEDFMNKKGFKKILENENIIVLLNKLAQIQNELDKYNKRFHEEENDFTISLKFDSENEQSIDYTDKILIIDDDINMLNFLENILRQEGYYVIISSDPEEGMVTLKEESVDLAIVDIMMPKKSGFDIYNYMIENNLDIPIFFLTGIKDYDLKIRAIREGIDHFIEKPFSTDKLLARVEGTIRRRKKRKINEVTDGLTGAYTRKFLMSRLKEEMNRHKRDKKEFSIAFIDIDNFKYINDNYGHVFGDKILKELVKNFKDFLRDCEQVFRYGGDEFVILFPETTGEEAYKGLERVRNKLDEKKFYNEDLDEFIKVSFSAGITMIDDYEISIQESIKKADEALYISKNEGKSKITYHFDKEVNKKKRVLVVDDSTIIVNLVKKRLEYLGYEVNYAKDGEEAITKLKKFQPHLLLLDLMLPKLNGMEVLKKIKEDKSLDELIVIILSARNKEKDMLQSLKMGATDFITKPFSLEIMEEKLRKLL